MLRIERDFLNLIRGVYQKPTANIIFNDETEKASKTKKKKEKGTRFGKGGGTSKLSFTNDTIVPIEYFIYHLKSLYVHALAGAAQWIERRPVNQRVVVRFPVRAHAGAM